MKIRLNLATEPLENHRRFLLGAALVAVVAFGLFAYLSRAAYLNWRETLEAREEQAEQQADIRDLQRMRRELDDYFRQAETRRVMDRAAFLGSLIQQRSFPWTQIFMDLERLLPDGVRVVSIAPRMEAGRVEVRLTVGATSDEAKLRFLRTLERAGEFRGVQVLSETRPARAADADQVMLELVAWYTSGG
jgi:Tfp pilus assembly protein PilN